MHVMHYGSWILNLKWMIFEFRPVSSLIINNYLSRENVMFKTNKFQQYSKYQYNANQTTVNALKFKLYSW